MFAICVSLHVCFILVLIFDFYVSKIMHLARSLPRKLKSYVSEEPRQN